MIAVNTMSHTAIAYVFIVCYMWILKESGHGWGQKVGGWECVWLIAIDYHAVTGTAGTGYRGDRRSKRARQPESRTDSGSVEFGLIYKEICLITVGLTEANVATVLAGWLSK